MRLFQNSLMACLAASLLSLAHAAELPTSSCISRPKHDYEDDLRIAGLKQSDQKSAATRHYSAAREQCPKLKTQRECLGKSAKEAHISFALCRWRTEASPRATHGKDSIKSSTKKAPKAPQ